MIDIEICRRNLGLPEKIDASEILYDLSNFEPFRVLTSQLTCDKDFLLTIYLKADCYKNQWAAIIQINKNYSIAKIFENIDYSFKTMYLYIGPTLENIYKNINLIKLKNLYLFLLKEYELYKNSGRNPSVLFEDKNLEALLENP